MSKLLTDVSRRELRSALERVGFVFRRQKGSHMILRRDEPYARCPFLITRLCGHVRCVRSCMMQVLTWKNFSICWEEVDSYRLRRQ